MTTTPRRASVRVDQPAGQRHPDARSVATPNPVSVTCRPGPCRQTLAHIGGEHRTFAKFLRGNIARQTCDVNRCDDRLKNFINRLGDIKFEIFFEMFDLHRLRDKTGDNSR